MPNATRHVLKAASIALLITVSASSVLTNPLHTSAQGPATGLVAKCSGNLLLDSLTGGALEYATDQLAAGAARLATSIGGPAFSAVTSIFGADAILRGLGIGEQDVRDAETRKATKKRNFDACVQAGTDAIFKVALSKMKKHLLDRTTDDIVNWISDGRDPKFITNFGDYLEEAGQAAVGDTAREIGLAELCSPLKRRIPPLLKPIPTFSQQASCTLDDIVDNIEGFYDDFSQGGPLAYAESWNPNNNLLGLLFATKDQVMKETAKKEEAAKLAASGGGYKPIEQCIEWTLTGTRKSDGKFVAFYVPTGEDFPYYHPSLPPRPESQPYVNAANTLNNVQYVCPTTKRQITLPPAGTQQIAGVALTADTQYLANTDDLSPYLNAIFDAAANRIIKEGAKGLRGSLSNLQSASRPLPTPEFCRRTDLTREQQNDCRYAGYGNEYRDATNLTTQLRNELTAQIAETRAGILAASTTRDRASALNLGFIATTTKLIECETSKLGGACTNTASARAFADARTLQLESDSISLEATLQSLTAIEASFASNATPSESYLTSLLTSVSTSLNAIRATQARLNNLLVSLLTAGASTDEALRACHTSAYSCSWTPPSP